MDELAFKPVIKRNGVDMLQLMNTLKRILIITIIFLVGFQLAACGIATPAPTVTATTTVASLIPIIPSITPTTIPSPTISFTATPDFCKFVQSQGKIQVISQDLFTALEPGGPVDFDRILGEQDPAWTDFQQDVHGEIRSAGVIFHETAFGPELGTGVNPAVLLITYGVEWDWELPANGDLVSEVDEIRARLHQHELEWILKTVDQSQYPVANAATYALYRYFNGDLSKLESWSSSFDTLFGVSPRQTMTSATALESLSSTVATPFLHRPFDLLDYPFRHITSFFDHHYPLYDAEGTQTDMARFDGTFFDPIPDPAHCGVGGDTGAGNYCYSGHPAYDYSIADVQVKAAADGHIVECSSEYGALWIEHENGLITSYLHMDPFYLPNGLTCPEISIVRPPSVSIMVRQTSPIN